MPKTLHRTHVGTVRFLRLVTLALLTATLASTTAEALTPAVADHNIVRFEPDSIELTPHYRDTIQSFAERYRSLMPEWIQVEGLMDEEEASGTQDVAWLRTQVVVNALVAEGIDRGQIVARAFRPKPTDRTEWPKLTPAQDREDRRLYDRNRFVQMFACNQQRCY